MKTNYLKTNNNNWNFYLQLLLVVIILYIYSFSWNYPIFDVWDDHRYILENKHLTFTFSNIIHWLTHSCVGCYLPFTMYSYMFDHYLWGFNSFGYHLQNIFWHITAVLAIFNCFKLLKINIWIAFFLCLIIAIHPQRVESVVWLSERKDVMCAAFYFLSIYFYINKKNHSSKSINSFSALSFIFFILAILSKPMAISLPIILLLYEWYLTGVSNQIPTNMKCRIAVNTIDSKSTRLEHEIINIVMNIRYSICKIIRLKQLYPYFLVIIIILPITIFTQTNLNFNGLQAPINIKVYSIFYNIYWYLKETIISTNLNPLYPTTELYFSFVDLIIFYIACIILMLIVFYKNSFFFTYKLLPIIICYIASLLPVIGIIRLGVIDKADRYSLIPSVFLWLAIGIILTKALLYKRIIPKNHKYISHFIFDSRFIFSALIIYLIILLISNINYQKVWKDKFSLFYYSIQHTPCNYMAIDYLIEMEYKRGNFDKVIMLSDKLGSIPGLKLMGDYHKALVEYKLDKHKGVKSLIEIEPKFRKGINFTIVHDRYVKILCFIISEYDTQKNKENTLKYIDKILSLHRISNFLRFTFMGLKASYLSNYQESITWYKKALKINPANKIVIEKLNQVEKANNFFNKTNNTKL